MSIVGTWTVFFEWVSPSPFPYQSASITFKPDGTFTSSGTSGHWNQIAGMLLFQFNVNNDNGCTYGGNWAGKSITGIMSTFDSDMAKGNFYMLQESISAAEIEVMAHDTHTASKSHSTRDVCGRHKR